MKKAIVKGFNTTLDYFPIVIQKSYVFCISIILVTFLESIFFYELVLKIQYLLDFKSRQEYSLFAFILMDENALLTYCSFLINIVFTPLLIINGFLLGVYYHQVGFPEQNQNILNVANVLDLPIQKKKDSVFELIKGISSQDWRRYLIAIGIVLLPGIFENIILRFLFILPNGITSLYFLINERVVYVLLIWLNWRWVKPQIASFKNREDIFWLLCLFVGVIPAIGSFLTQSLMNYVVVGLYALIAMLYEMQLVLGLLYLFLFFLFFLLWLPFVAIFYSQTIIAINNEVED